MAKEPTKNNKAKVFAGLRQQEELPANEAAPRERAKREVISEYDIKLIKPSKDNTFSQNKDERFEELKESIKADGIFEPLKIYEDPEEKGTYIIFSGHRRFAAATELGLEKVPCLLIKGTFSPAEINAKLFAFNQGNRGDDPFGRARSIKKHIELNKLSEKKLQSEIEKAFHLPHGRSTTRLVTLAKLDYDILVLAQLGLLTASQAEEFIAASEGNDELLSTIQERIREIYNSEKDLDSQKATIKRSIVQLIKKPRTAKQPSAAISVKHMKKALDALSPIDLSAETARKKKALKASLTEIRDMIDEKLKELE